MDATIKALNEYRIKRGLSRRKLAKEIGISYGVMLYTFKGGIPFDYHMTKIQKFIDTHNIIGEN